jgi:hypothetical protein
LVSDGHISKLFAAKSDKSLLFEQMMPTHEEGEGCDMVSICEIVARYQDHSVEYITVCPSMKWERRHSLPIRGVLQARTLERR